LAQSAAPEIVIEHATVIDGTGAPPRKDVTVVIGDGRIISIGPSVKPAANTRVIDATGEFLIPGLWDMHFHLDSQGSALHTLAANGITGIREMYWARGGRVPRIHASPPRDSSTVRSCKFPI
jgi:imidazolonepropionase-like amidohydrolase